MKIDRTDLKNKAIELRKQGEAIIDIAKKLEVAVSTMQAWVSKVVLSQEMKDKNKELGKERAKLALINRSKSTKPRKKYVLTKKRVAWNKGLTNETSEIVRRISATNSRITQEKLRQNKYHYTGMSEAARKKLSQEQSLKNRGGKCKWFVVDGKNVQGTYEKLFAEKLVVEGIKWERINTNTYIFTYIRDNKEKSYSPDFYLPEYNLYIEIKGFWWHGDKEKMYCVKEQHSDKNVVIIFGKTKLLEICKNIKENLPKEPFWNIE